MIKNERQYRVTQTQAKKFAESLAQFTKESSNNAAIHPLLLKAQKDALQSQLDDLQAEIEEYEALKSGQQQVLELNSLEELPSALIKARIASGLTQKELAEQLGIKEQQIQRYEATEYASASLTRINEIVQALGIQVREDVFLPSSQVSLNTLFSRLKPIGIDRDFVIKRLLPRSISQSLQNGEIANERSGTLALRGAAILNKIFEIQPANLFSSNPLKLNRLAISSARFKVPKGANEERFNTYTLYAHYLALLVQAVTVDLPKNKIPTHPAEVRDTIISNYGSLTFKHALQYIWSLGIPVLPLNDSGAFHGAFWRIQGRNIIVLKQKSQFTARWLFDLLHELWHAAQEPELDERTIIEATETAQERRESEEEETADKFAGYIILDGHAEDLVELCAKEAKDSIERLKKVVPQIATRENVSVSSLANYMAFCLSLEGKDWWGAATNLQKEDTNYAEYLEPWHIARDIFLENVDFGKLNQIDRNILIQALSN